MGAMRINLNELRRIILEAMLNAYQVLGVPQNASDDEIKAAWKKLALANHPDRGGSHGKMVDINNAKDRLLDKTNLFRYGPNFKGYENAAQPAAGPTVPEMKPCPKCGRNVSVKDGKLVGHYTEQGGNVKCEGSFKPAAGAAPPSGGSRRNAEDDFWDYVRNRAERERSQQQPPPPPGGGSGAGGRPWSGPPPRSGPTPPPGGGAWRASRGRPGYEYNQQTGEYRRAPGAPGAAGAGPTAGTHRYFTYIGGRSRKFWEIELVGRTLYVRWGRIGSPGFTKPYTYANEQRARDSMRNMAQGKIDKGYVEGTAPRGPRPSQSADAGAAPNAGPAPGAAQGGRPEPTGRPSQDSYKVYGWRQGRRVVRVGGKLYGTGPGGNLSGGGQTRFNANDRGRVSRTPDGKMRVTKQGADGTDHSQTWDPIEQSDEVAEAFKSKVDELVLEMFRRIAESE